MKKFDQHNSVCDKCYRKTWYETEQRCHMPGCTGTLRVIDYSEIKAHPLAAFEGARVEVKYNDGTKQRFWVGRTTGWKPTLIAVNNTRSTGGTIAPKQFKSVRVVKHGASMGGR